MEEIKLMCALITSVAAAGAVLWKIREKFNAIVEGIRCQLRTEMLRTYYRHRDDGVIRQYEMENFEHNYNAYKALGGNSFIDKIHGEVKSWEVVS